MRTSFAQSVGSISGGAGSSGVVSRVLLLWLAERRRRAEGEDGDDEGEDEAEGVEQEGQLRHTDPLPQHVEPSVDQRARHLQNRDVSNVSNTW